MLHSAVGGGLRHDHSKGIVGRDDGSGHRRDDWWEERAEMSVTYNLSRLASFIFGIHPRPGVRVFFLIHFFSSTAPTSLLGRWSHASASHPAH